MPRGADSTVVADVLYAVGAERLGISVDLDLPRRQLANEVITDAIAMREDPLEVIDDLSELAEALDWSMTVETDGPRTNVRIF